MKKEDLEKGCPCQSGKLYRECCRLFHEGQLPATALELMRSRYAAYALCKPDYIIQTTHPANAQFSLDTVKWSEQIRDFCLNTEFRGLKIIDFQESPQTATVTFRAHLMQNGKDGSFTEKSYFEKVGERWLYHSGEFL